MNSLRLRKRLVEEGKEVAECHSRVGMAQNWLGKAFDGLGNNDGTNPAQFCFLEIFVTFGKGKPSGVI